MTPAPEAVTGCALLFSILLTIILITLPIGITTLWICMIVYCIKYQKKDRTAWMLINCLCGPLGGIIYFFFKDSKNKEIKNLKNAPI